MALRWAKARKVRVAVVAAGGAFLVMAGMALGQAGTQASPLVEFPDEHGRVGVLMPRTDDAAAFFDTTLSPTGRACVTCHQPSDAMSISAATVRSLWQRTKGHDPIFFPSDGSNCPSLPQDKPESHSLLLKRGLFRIGLAWPPKARDGTPITPEFDIEVISDPTGCNLDPHYGLHSVKPTISVFRRPRPTANLTLIDTYPWRNSYNFKTGRPFETDPETGRYVSMNLMSDARALTLPDQARQALRDHMNVPKPDPAVVDKIVRFERGVFMAQSFSKSGGPLDGADAPEAIGPTHLSKVTSIANGDKYILPVFHSLDAWRPKPGQKLSPQTAFLASVARGYDVFFLRPFYIRDAMGINSIGLGNPIKRTCSTCHMGEFTGNDIINGTMDTGTVNTQTRGTARAFYDDLARDLPLFRIRCKASAKPQPFLGRDIVTLDPGRALITGRCSDVGSITLQQFRGLSARAPYFASGSAANFAQLIDFYDTRFEMRLTPREKIDLANFLSVL